MTIEGVQQCGAAWLSSSPTGGSVPAGDSTTVTLTLDPTGLVPGVYEANYCIASNDSASPLVTVPVTLTVDAVPTDPVLVAQASPDTLDLGQLRDSGFGNV